MEELRFAIMELLLQPAHVPGVGTVGTTGGARAIPIVPDGSTNNTGLFRT